jgi:LmbE family N-acetylglucosaminyl deacetylase
LDIAETETLDNHDGELLPEIHVRREIVRRIRDWRADVVLTHRPFDYHPDHRYTGQLVQDSAYLVLVPNICPETKPLQRNPVYLYLEDRFRKPYAFTPDVAVDIDRVWGRKIEAMDAHASQFYEWLPWIEGDAGVPHDPRERKEWLSARWTRPVTPAVREALIRRYGQGRGCAVEHAEAFELCEYGSKPAPEELERIFAE